MTTSVKVLENGYKSKRITKTWKVNEAVENSRNGLLKPSRYILRDSKVQVLRDSPVSKVFPTACEYLKDDPVIKVFYDWDCKCADLGSSVSFKEDAELYSLLKTLADLEGKHLDKLKKAMRELHPDVDDSHIAYASRSGFKRKGKLGYWVVSLRCYITTRKIKLSDIPRLIFDKLGKRFEELDRSVYKSSEQCLGMV